MTTALERGEKKQVPRRLAPVRSDKSSESRTAAWARSWATAGAAAWAGIAVLARMGIARVGAIELLFLFAPLVIVPLGMELGRMMGSGGRLAEIARRLQPAGAAFAVAAMGMGPGRKAGLLALGWLVVCLLVAGTGAET